MLARTVSGLDDEKENIPEGFELPVQECVDIAINAGCAAAHQARAQRLAETGEEMGLTEGIAIAIEAGRAATYAANEKKKKGCGA